MSDLKNLLENRRNVTSTSSKTSNLVKDASKYLGCDLCMTTLDFVLKGEDEIRTTDLKLDVEGAILRSKSRR